jgi:antirestriction protein ArdC
VGLSECCYSSPYWVTFKQAQEIGGHVRKGEHGCPVVFWKFLEKGEERQDGEETEARRVPVEERHAPAIAP